MEVERAAQTGRQGGPMQGCKLRLVTIMLLAGVWEAVWACHSTCATAC